MAHAECEIVFIFFRPSVRIVQGFTAMVLESSPEAEAALVLELGRSPEPLHVGLPPRRRIAPCEGKNIHRTFAVANVSKLTFSKADLGLNLVECVEVSIETVNERPHVSVRVQFSPRLRTGSTLA